MTDMPMAPDVTGQDLTLKAQEALERPSGRPYSPEDYFNSLIHEKASLYRKTALVRAVQMEHDFEVLTLEGTMRAKAGDYLCKGQDGEFWPVKQDIFERIYVRAD